MIKTQISNKQALKDGSTTIDRRCDLIFDYSSIPLKHLYRTGNRKLKSVRRECPIFLDQGMEGACVGFGITHALIALYLSLRPDLIDEFTAEFAKKKIYWEAQKEDPWEGGSYPGANPFYEGTTVNAGLKEANELNYISSFIWAVRYKDLLLSMQDGPVVIGIKMTEGMMVPDSNGYIWPTGKDVGGHCIYLEELNIEKDFVVIHQSWGTNHGIGGRVKMTLKAFETIYNRGGQGAVLFPDNPEKADSGFLSWFFNFFK